MSSQPTAPYACPQCGNRDMNTGRPEMTHDIREIVMYCDCGECNAHWAEYYRFRAHEMASE